MSRHLLTVDASDGLLLRLAAQLEEAQPRDGIQGEVTLGVARREVSRKPAPEVRERRDETVVRPHPQLELVRRVEVEDDREPGAEQHVERGVELFQILRVEFGRARLVEERRGLDREAHVVEAETLDEFDVLSRGVLAQVLLRVVARLCEPVAQVDAAPHVRQPRSGHGRSRLRPTLDDRRDERHE